MVTPDRRRRAALLALPVVLGAGIAVPWVKERVSYPRIGYAETRKPADEASPWGGVAFSSASA